MDRTPTPTPWTAEPGGKRGSWIKGTTGEWAALACGDTDESARANAALIVRAVNSHAALVEALRSALAMIDASSLGKPGNILSRDRIASMRAALALAAES